MLGRDCGAVRGWQWERFTQYGEEGGGGQPVGQGRRRWCNGRTRRVVGVHCWGEEVGDGWGLVLVCRSW
jgi:hypothetical protein